MASEKNYPYACELDIRFPTAQHAKDTMRVMEVDQELGDRVVKTFQLVDEEPAVLRVYVSLPLT
jgi:hypothetical protein